ncbi:MAG: hypothetical protein ILO68_01425, partial [Clostridia bacterium]|nr:hypothetical protein [Clostridia bacterium]
KVLTNLSVSLPENDLSATASLTWFDLSEAGASFTGDLSVTQKQNGLLITLPASFDGGFSAGDGKADFRLHFAVKAQGVLDTEFSLTLSLQKTDTDIAAPEKSVPLSEILQDPTDLLKKLTERYPELMKSVSGLFASKQSISFVTADYAMAFDWYSDGTAVYSACFPFEDTGKEIVLSYEGYEIIRIPYRKSGGTVQILGYELDLYEGEGYESFYRDGADFGIEMYTNGLAFLIAAQPWDGSVDELKLSFPDGTEYAYELIWGEDGTTVTVKGGPVFHMVSQTDVDTV